MGNNTAFQDIDGLVLATLACVSSDNILSWIEFIDCYYRIILSYEELNDSLIKLQKSGLIVYEHEKMCCTEYAKNLLTGRSRMSTSKWIFKVQERIAKTVFEDSYDVHFSILKEEYVDKINEYHARTKKHYK